MTKQGDNLLIAGNDLQGIISNRAQVLKIDTSFNTINIFNFDSLTNSPTFCSTNVGIMDYINLEEISNSTYYASGFYPVPYSGCNDDDQVVYAIVKNNSQTLKGQQYGATGGVREAAQNNSSLVSKKDKYIYNVCMSGLTNQIIMGTTYSPTSILIAKIDTSGNLVWQKYFNTPNYYYEPLGVFATSDSCSVISGMRYDTQNPSLINAFEGFILKLDKNGNILYSNVNVSEQKINISTFELYPNPTNDETFVNFNLITPDEVAIRVLNNIGQIVYQANANLNAGSNKMNIDTRDFSSGIYNVMLESKNGVIIKKLCVTK
jgi:hypothetical protein